jgi:hypothetical protein
MRNGILTGTEQPVVQVTGMTPVHVKIEVIVFDSNDEKHHVREVCTNTLTRLECTSVHVDSAAHRQHHSGRRTL